ncbi:MAG: PadR family transcriptional regulator [Phycisphaerales bacterium JB038]
MRIERELMRGAGPVAVLKLLKDKEMYGYELVQALEDRSRGVLEMGQSTLYPMLYNLEAKGLIEAAWQEADSGRKRKYYRLTDKGARKLAADTKQWRALAGAMQARGILGGQETPQPTNLLGALA